MYVNTPTSLLEAGHQSLCVDIPLGQKELTVTNELKSAFQNFWNPKLPFPLWKTFQLEVCEYCQITRSKPFSWKLPGSFISISSCILSQRKESPRTQFSVELLFPWMQLTAYFLKKIHYKSSTQRVTVFNYESKVCTTGLSLSYTYLILPVPKDLAVSLFS